MSLYEDLARVETQVPDPKAGLQEEVFRFATRIIPMINVDLLIKDKQKWTLLT